MSLYKNYDWFNNAYDSENTIENLLVYHKSTLWKSIFIVKNINSFEYLQLHSSYYWPVVNHPRYKSYALFAALGTLPIKIIIQDSKWHFSTSNSFLSADSY